MNFIVASELSLAANTKIHKLKFELQPDAVDAPFWINAGIHVVAERINNQLREHSSTLLVDVRKENKKMASMVKVTIIADTPVRNYI